LPASPIRLASFDARLRSLPWPARGRVEEAHAHSAVVVLADGGGLVLLAAGRPLVPWGVRLPAEARLPGPGSAVLLEDGRLRILEPGREQEPFFFEGEGQELHVPCRVERAKPGRVAASVWAELPDRTRALLRGSAPPTDPTDRTDRSDRSERSQPGFDQLEIHLLTFTLKEILSCVLRPAGQPAMATVVRRLAGLGRGSTPAGDDLLAGAAAAARALGLPGARALCGCLAELPAGHTTPAGGAMLREAARGYYPAPLATAARSLPRLDPAPLRDLAGLGATSGADMLAGFLAMLEEPHA